MLLPQRKKAKLDGAQNCRTVAQIQQVCKPRRQSCIFVSIEWFIVCSCRLDKADPSAHQAGASSQLDSKKKNALFSESSDESKTGALPLSHAASAPQKANVLDESSSDPFEDIKRKQAAAPDVTAAVVAKPIPVPEAVVIKTPKSGRRSKDKEKIRKHESAGRKRTDTQVDTDVQGANPIVCC